MRVPALLILTVLLAVLLAASPSPAQPLETDARTIDLGTVIGDEPVERSFTVTNRGPAPVRIRDVQLTPPLTVTRMKATVAPGQSSEIVVRLGSPRPAGDYEGQVTVRFEDSSAEPLVLEVGATLVPPIELRPGPELVAVTDRGVEARDSLEIVSHLEEPLELRGGAVTNERFSTSLETLEPGRRYRLSLVLSGKGAGGRQTDAVMLETSSPAYPRLSVSVRTSLRERVHTFPDRLDFGPLAIASMTGDAVRLRDTSVMVYQKDGRDFQLKVSTDVPFLVLRPEKSTKFGDRWQIFCSIDPAKLTPGPVSGSLTIETNDREFPKLVVPVEAVVQ